MRFPNTVRVEIIDRAPDRLTASIAMALANDLPAVATRGDVELAAAIAAAVKVLVGGRRHGGRTHDPR